MERLFRLGWSLKRKYHINLIIYTSSSSAISSQTLVLQTLEERTQDRNEEEEVHYETFPVTYDYDHVRNTNPRLHRTNTATLRSLATLHRLEELYTFDGDPVTVFSTRQAILAALTQKGITDPTLQQSQSSSSIAESDNSTEY